MMQVIVRDSLDEDRRVARFPKPSKNNTSSPESTTTTSKPRMQLVVENEAPEGNKFFWTSDDNLLLGLVTISCGFLPVCISLVKIPLYQEGYTIGYPQSFFEL